MATIRVHEDQENRITNDLRGRGKKTVATTLAAQAQALQQGKRAVFGVLHTNCSQNVPRFVRTLISSSLSRFSPPRHAYITNMLSS